MLLLCSALLSGHVSNEKEDIGVIGIREASLSHTISVVRKGTPAEQAGLKKGDKILSSIDEFGKHNIDGIPDTQVTLTIKRDQEIFDVTLTRRGARSLGLNPGNYHI